MSPVLLLAVLVAWSGGDSAASGSRPCLDAHEGLGQDLEQGTEPELLERFNRSLQGFRSGEDGHLTELRRLTRALEERFGRTDVGSTARHFQALSRHERLEGVERQARFEELRSELVRAGREGVADWPALRTRVLSDLRALEDECLLAPDPTPAGHAAAQRAFLLVEWAAVQPDAVQRAALEAQATEAAERSLRAFRRAGQRTPTLLPRWVLGRLARARLDRAGANAQFRACVQIATEVGQPEWRERGLLGLVSLARDAGSLREVERLLEELRSFRDWLESWPLRRELALLDLSRDQPALALDQLGPLPDEPRARVEGLRIRTAALTRAGRLEDAAAALGELEELVSANDPSLVLAAAHLEAGRGAWQEALARLEDLPTAATAAARTQAAALEGCCALRLGDSARADEALTRAQASAAAWQRSHYEANGSVTGEWLGVQALVWGAQARLELGRPLEALALLERQGEDSLRRDAREPDLVAWARHFELGLLSLTLGADDGLAVHLSPQGEVTSAALPHGRAEVARAVERLLQAAWDRDDERVARLGEELGQALLPAPVREPWRRSNPDERLLVVLHGALEALPVHLLRVEGRWLDEGLVPVVLPALPARAPGLRPSLAGAGWSLLGSPLLGGSGHPPLPEARAELEHVRSTLGGQHRVDTGASFTRSALLQALNRRQPLHLATHLVADAACDHGVLSPTAIVTTDGVLCAGEVLAQEPALPLAVLNACGTARGVVVDGEGLMGLARAFLMGGTRSVLATLWPIEDRAARLGIETFHALLAEGRRPSEAAAGARRDLRERGFPAADWAALRLLGRD
jgi:CHAT domain-containing protein